MKSQMIGLRVAGTIFGLLAIAHLARLAIRPEVMIAGYAVPLWPSIPAFIFLTGLSAWMWSLSRAGLK